MSRVNESWAKRVDSLLALAEDAGGGGGGAGQLASLVYLQGGVADPAAGVFADWPSLYIAIQALGEAAYTVTVDASNVGGTATVPAGTYHLGFGTFTGDAGTILQFLNGAHVAAEHVLTFSKITANNAGSTPTITAGSGSLMVLQMVYGAVLTGNAGAVFFSALSGAFALVLGTDFASIGDGTHAAVTSAAGFFFLNAAAGTAVLANALAGTAGFFQFSSDAQVAATAPGGWTTVVLSDAKRDKYTAAVSGDWSGTNPTSVANALDRIAAKITPIP